MKKTLTLFVCLFAVYFCKSQELYIVIDTRDSVNIKHWVDSYKTPSYYENDPEYYIITRDDPAEDYGGGIWLRYVPYTDKRLKKWKNIRKLRTLRISKKEWAKIKMKPTSKIVDGLEWVRKTPWDSIYKQMHQYNFFKGGMYVVDEKFTTMDSIQIRGVDFMDVRAEYCY